MAGGAGDRGDHDGSTRSSPVSTTYARVGHEGGDDEGPLMQHSTTRAELMTELRLSYKLSGPVVVAYLCQMSLGIVVLMFVGHLGENGASLRVRPRGG